jgi:hypothetical protein
LPSLKKDISDEEIAGGGSHEGQYGYPQQQQQQQQQQQYEYQQQQQQYQVRKFSGKFLGNFVSWVNCPLRLD